MIALELRTYGDPDQAMSSFSDVMHDKDPEVRELAAVLIDDQLDEIERQSVPN